MTSLQRIMVMLVLVMVQTVETPQVRNLPESRREVAPEKTCLTQSDPEETELVVSSSDQHLLRPAPPQTSTSSDQHLLLRSTAGARCRRVTLPHKKKKKPRENSPAAERWSS